MGKSGFRVVPLRTVQQLETAGDSFFQAYQGRKGRGAVSNLQGRFDSVQRIAFDDGWGAIQDDHEVGSASGLAQEVADSPALHTVVTHEIAKSILSRNQSPDLPFNVSLNPYRGCEHEMWNCLCS